ncbi:MAG: trypsin-like peptidase domain-containing protein [Clostridia bacterium]|nr:trypsin-like peptidase domain-containing protein [Clostridia bacterium]
MNKKLKSFFAILLLVPCFFVFSACNQTGKSAYDIAVDNGFVGTEQEWLDSLKGDDGKSAYDIAVENGFSGTEQDWLDSFVLGKSAYQSALENGFVGSEIEWLQSLQGAKGDSGDCGMQNAISTALTSVVSVFANFTVQGVFGASIETSGGAGVIVDIDKQKGNAYIITNYHVIYYNGVSSDISLYLYGMEYSEYKIEATYIGGSLTNDIAVLEVKNNDVLKNSNATKATFDISCATVGTQVSAIGNPSGTGISATQGIISVDSEEITLTLADGVTQGQLRVMRVDAAVNSGNSGGGLFNASGKLIGIVNAKYQSTTIENIAYAIPAVVAYGVYQNVISQTNTNNDVKVQKCKLGIEVMIDDSWAEYDSATQTTKIKQKIKIANVLSTGVAYGKLMADDVLVSVNLDGKQMPVYKIYNVGDYLLYFKQGDQMQITVLRGGVEQTVTINLTQPPQTIS